ncbi:MAG: hypothetical protein V1819_03585 [bacterium]
MASDDLLNLFRENKTVLTAREVSLLWGPIGKDKIKSRLNYYVKTGALVSLRRGVYVKDKNNYDKLELATKIYTPAYVSLNTVLRNEGVVFQYYESIFVASYLSREIKCGGQNFVFRKFKNSILTNPLGLIKQGNYFIASKERAFLDTIYLYQSYYFDNLRSLDWQKCFELLPIYQNKALEKKLKFYQKQYQDA